ncbi:MAG: hypothetical protein ACJ76P_04155 [Actinomycetota bacterium]
MPAEGTALNIEPYLEAHAFVRVERPPEIWEVECSEKAFLGVLGESIVAGLARGNSLGDLLLNVSNVVVEDDAPGAAPPRGRFVALSVSGAGDWEPELVWTSERPVIRGVVGADLDAAFRAAGVPYTYVRVGREGGSLGAYLRATG